MNERTIITFLFISSSLHLMFAWVRACVCTYTASVSQISSLTHLLLTKMELKEHQCMRKIGKLRTLMSIFRKIQRKIQTFCYNSPKNTSIWTLWTRLLSIYGKIRSLCWFQSRVGRAVISWKDLSFAKATLHWIAFNIVRGRHNRPQLVCE